ncbi:hypothetical protein SAMN05443428_11126 [Caloramator quimbayensis]|uniref:Short-chain dehydrogenase n=1 Tax=Caloramator quimbayensis TaxID=1147123 RepID=A0A1T4XQ26_9CLOT|nr:SDR family NAD(P)-dependent oxidoreductase [Caloramator quimbayensis]SKA91238.1 hypothetical protein SAMN05443428_11126 [Caloramator quimbayensis]
MKTAIITGASSGIGLELSKSLIESGFKVYGFGRNFDENNLKDTNFIPVICDLTNVDNLTQIIKGIKSKEDVYVLVNNAGVGYFGPHEELNSRKIHEMVMINLEVPLILTQQLLRDLKKNEGYIINISSVTAKKISTYGCAYAATKAGLSHFAESLFEEVRKYGVKVVTIHPDITKTNFYRNANFKEGEKEDTYIYPAEIADAVKMVLTQREGLVLTDITLKPQRHRISRK